MELPARDPIETRRYRSVGYRSLTYAGLAAVLVEGGTLRLPAAALLATATVSILALAALPSGAIRSSRFGSTLAALDAVLLATGLVLAGPRPGMLAPACVLMVLVVALATNRTHALAAATVVCALHTGLVLRSETVLDAARRLPPDLLLLSAIGLYLGYLVRAARKRRRMTSAETRTRHELKTLLDIQDTITSTMDLAEATRTIVSKVAAIVPANRCSVLFIDRKRTRCFVLASHDDPEVDMLEIDLRKYPEVRRAIETRSSVVIQDVARDPLMAEVRTILEGLDFQSIMVVPLLFGEEVLGTLCLRGSESARPFSPGDLRFCNAAARVSACAIKNGQLREHIEDEVTRFRAMGDKLSRILDHSPDLILTTDQIGTITEFSRGAERLLGHSRHEVIGRSFEMLLGEGDAPDMVARTLVEGQLANHARRLRTSSGSMLDFELNLSVLRDDKQAASGTVWLGRDVTELKATQTQLLQAKKLSTIGEVISGVAHELSNPLSCVLGFSQLLLAREVPDVIRTDLDKINDSALRCQKIVKNLLSFARGHKPERRHLGINGIIDKTLDIKRYQFRVHNIEVIRDLEPGLPRTMLDFHQIQQVLLNLFNNAQHAMAAHRDRTCTLRIRSRSEGANIRVEITDDGEGMDQETLERIFDPFFTTKEPGKGTGLGLSVSYGIVENHGGRIYARSRRNEGTTFVIELPIRGAEQASTAAATARDSVAPTTMSNSRILVVDDEPMILDLLLDVLEDGGYRIDTASSGDEAFRKIGGESYDLVISDVRMPGMNGLQLYRRALGLRPELEGRMLFVTGDLIDRETIDFLAETGARTLAKPIEIDKVRELVRVMVAPEAVAAASTPSGRR